MGELLAFAALVLFSSNIIITKIATARLNLHIGFLISVGVNVLFSALLLSGQWLFLGIQELEWNTRGFFLFSLTGLFSTYLGRWFFFETVEKLGPARASTFQVSNPLFTTVIAWIFMDENLTGGDLLSIIFILSGLFFVSYVPQKAWKAEVAVSKQTIKTESHVIEKVNIKVSSIKWILKTGIFMAFISSLSYAIGNVLRGAAIQNWNQPILGGLLGALAGLLLHCVFSRNTRNFWSQIKNSDPYAVWMYVISGILTISAQICVIASMWYIPISIANLITMSTPMLVTPVSYILFKNQEGITIRTLIGIIMVLMGISAIVLV